MKSKTISKSNYRSSPPTLGPVLHKVGNFVSKVGPFPLNTGPNKMSIKSQSSVKSKHSKQRIVHNTYIQHEENSLIYKGLILF